MWLAAQVPSQRLSPYRHRSLKYPNRHKTRLYHHKNHGFNSKWYLTSLNSHHPQGTRLLTEPTTNLCLKHHLGASKWYQINLGTLPSPNDQFLHFAFKVYRTTTSPCLPTNLASMLKSSPTRLSTRRNRGQQNNNRPHLPTTTTWTRKFQPMREKWTLKSRLTTSGTLMILTKTRRGLFLHLEVGRRNCPP